MYRTGFNEGVKMRIEHCLGVEHDFREVYMRVLMIPGSRP